MLLGKCPDEIEGLESEQLRLLIARYFSPYLKGESHEKVLEMIDRRVCDIFVAGGHQRKPIEFEQLLKHFARQLSFKGIDIQKMDSELEDVCFFFLALPSSSFLPLFK